MRAKALVEESEKDAAVRAQRDQAARMKALESEIQHLRAELEDERSAHAGVGGAIGPGASPEIEATRREVLRLRRDVIAQQAAFEALERAKADALLERQREEAARKDAELRARIATQRLQFETSQKELEVKSREELARQVQSLKGDLTELQRRMKAFHGGEPSTASSGRRSGAVGARGAGDSVRFPGIRGASAPAFSDGDDGFADDSRRDAGRSAQRADRDDQDVFLGEDDDDDALLGFGANGSSGRSRAAEGTGVGRDASFQEAGEPRRRPASHLTASAGEARSFRAEVEEPPTTFSGERDGIEFLLRTGRRTRRFEVESFGEFTAAVDTLSTLRETITGLSPLMQVDEALSAVGVAIFDGAIDLSTDLSVAAATVESPERSKSALSKPELRRRLEAGTGSGDFRVVVGAPDDDEDAATGAALPGALLSNPLVSAKQRKRRRRRGPMTVSIQPANRSAIPDLFNTDRRILFESHVNEWLSDMSTAYPVLTDSEDGRRLFRTIAQKFADLLWRERVLVARVTTAVDKVLGAFPGSFLRAISKPEEPKTAAAAAHEVLVGKSESPDARQGLAAAIARLDSASRPKPDAAPMAALVDRMMDLTLTTGPNISLASCDLEDAAMAPLLTKLCRVLPRSRFDGHTLDLTNNRFTDVGASDLAAFLRLPQLGPLRLVDLQRNRISRHGMRALAEACRDIEGVRHVVVDPSGRIEALGPPPAWTATLGPEAAEDPSSFVSRLVIDARANNPYDPSLGGFAVGSVPSSAVRSLPPDPDAEAFSSHGAGPSTWLRASSPSTRPGTRSTIEVVQEEDDEDEDEDEDRGEEDEDENDFERRRHLGAFERPSQGSGTGFMAGDSRNRHHSLSSDGRPRRESGEDDEGDASEDERDDRSRGWRGESGAEHAEFARRRGSRGTDPGSAPSTGRSMPRATESGATRASRPGVPESGRLPRPDGFASAGSRRAQGRASDRASAAARPPRGEIGGESSRSAGRGSSASQAGLRTPPRSARQEPSLNSLDLVLGPQSGPSDPRAGPRRSSGRSGAVSPLGAAQVLDMLRDDRAED